MSNLCLSTYVTDIPMGKLLSIFLIQLDRLDLLKKASPKISFCVFHIWIFKSCFKSTKMFIFSSCFEILAFWLRNCFNSFQSQQPFRRCCELLTVKPYSHLHFHLKSRPINGRGPSTDSKMAVRGVSGVWTHTMKGTFNSGTLAGNQPTSTTTHKSSMEKFRLNTVSSFGNLI